jgi:predicted RNA binding protein YcfA (HicA-like mRNA interferase family)
MKLPAVSADEAVKAFQRLGYGIDRQRGSHILLRQAGPPYRRLSVPNHKETREGNAARADSRGGIDRR